MHEAGQLYQFLLKQTDKEKAPQFDCGASFILGKFYRLLR
ncbi:hypothetical protein D515_02055 [Grimontia indica]|uniref:Uncharacterized protein n=1 Tax=Grimontia indica TaxID=1056512 RepID=R1GSC9_9GAMM|nr:hypothetical protein D515_02055 [Grimontia indica]